MKTFYVIRSGSNSANQSSVGTCRNPQNQFESNQYQVVGIAEADSADSAIAAADATCYSGQSVFAVTRLNSVKGLTQAVRNFLDTDDGE
jgi:hypothetical protein